MKKHPIIAFYFLAFVISWLGWVPQALHARGWFPFYSPVFSFLGAGGPTLAAVIVIGALQGRDGPRGLFAPLLRWRAVAGWWSFVLLFWFAAAAAALGLGALFGQPLPALDGIVWWQLLPVFVTMLLSNVWEEIGWRGFALPRLQKEWPRWQVVLVMGLLWSLWHLPLMLNPSSPMSGLGWAGEVVFSLALTMIYTWLYNGTEGSLWFVSIFHAMSNTVAYFLLEAGVFESSYGLVVVVTSAAALAIAVLSRKKSGIQGD
jgi:membrane protease YdiL (CAAX protease family)